MFISHDPFEVTAVTPEAITTSMELVLAYYVTIFVLMITATILLTAGRR